MADDFGNAPISNIFSQYDPLEAGDIGDIDLYGQNIGSLYPDIIANLPNLDLQNLLGDNDLFAAFAKFDPESAALLKAGNLTSTGTSALTGEGIIADAAADKISDELGGDTTKLSSLTQDPGDVALVKPDDINKNVKVVDKRSSLEKLLSGDVSASDAAKYAALLAMAKMAYNDAQKAREEARGWSAPGGAAKQALRGPGGGVSFKPAGKAIGGGIGSLDMAQGGRALPPRYLDGHSDGMADKVPANIDGRRPAALSDGEFVIPADVVSHLGNGNSNAGAKRLYKMMDDIRAARTGNPKQGKQINPDKFMPR